MMRGFALVSAFLIATPAAAQSSGSQTSASQAPVAQRVGYGAPIQDEAAIALVQKAIKLSAAKDLRMAIAVVEPSGELVAFAKMDDAPYASTQLAQKKARTAARLRMSTARAEASVQAGRAALLSTDEVVAIGGGVPIIVDGQVIGAVGVSGGTAAEDAAIAEAAIAPR